MRLARICMIAAIGALITVALTRAQSESNAKSEPATTGRYQLVAATVVGFGNSATTAEQRVFMLDTVTGKVWSYVPSGPFTTPAGKPAFTPEMLVRVFVDEIEGSVPDQMQKTVDYFEKHPAMPMPPKR